MNRKDVLATSVVCFLFISVSCVLSRLLSNVFVKLCDLFVELTFISASGVRAVTLFGFSLFFVGLFSYKYGYKTGLFDMEEIFVSSAASSLAHLALSSILGFSPWIAGATKHIGGFLRFGSNYVKADYMSKISFGLLLLVGAVNGVLFAVVLCGFECLGVKKRLRDRAELVD